MAGLQDGAGLLVEQIESDPHGPFPIDIPFLRLLGVSLLAFGDGRAELGLAHRPELQNTFGMAHGGVVMTLLDVAMAMAARAAQPYQDDDRSKGMITIEMKTSFLRPSRGALRALGQCLHRTSTLAFCEAELRDDTGSARARASGTFKYLKVRS